MEHKDIGFDVDGCAMAKNFKLGFLTETLLLTFGKKFLTINLLPDLQNDGC